ncbi:hypothetical protein ACQY0O_008165 [Thecaphora frezii]
MVDFQPGFQALKSSYEMLESKAKHLAQSIMNVEKGKAEGYSSHPTTAIFHGSSMTIYSGNYRPAFNSRFMSDRYASMDGYHNHMSDYRSERPGSLGNYGPASNSPSMPDHSDNSQSGHYSSSGSYGSSYYPHFRAGY